MRETVRLLATLPFRIMPPRLRRRIVRAVLYASAAGSPPDALRELLAIDTDVSGMTDEVALAYGGGVHVKHRLMQYHDFFVDRVRKGERVLDIGCGYGAVAHSITTRSEASVVGLDSDPANIAKAKTLFAHERLDFVVGEAPRDVPTSRFDVVVISNVLEHVERRVDFLRDVQARVGASRWLVRVPMFNRDWRPSLRQELGLFPYCDPTHVTEYTREGFEREMAEAGFSARHLQVNWGEIWAEVAPLAGAAS
jgi:SAM-dependent methyltransferase